MRAEQSSWPELEPRRENLFTGLPEPSDPEAVRGPSPPLCSRETFPSHPLRGRGPCPLLLTSSPPAEGRVCPGWRGLVYEKPWLLRLWLYWPLIKQFPGEAHNEAGDWCRWRVHASPGFIGSAPLPHPLHQSELHLLGHWLGRGNELSARAPQSTGTRRRDYVPSSRRF